MMNIIKVTVIALTVFAGATVAQADQSSADSEFTIDQYIEDLERNAG